jgi:hypothetical protein
MRIFIFLLPVLLAVHAFAQSKKDIKKYGIKSITTENLEMVNGQEKKFTDSYERFDSNGNVTEKKEFAKDGSFKSHESYKLNKNGLPVETLVYNEKGAVISKTITVYDDEDSKKEEIVYTGTGQLTERTKFIRNSRGEKTSEMTYNAEGKLIRKTVFSYDKNGMRTEKKVYDGNDKLISAKKYIITY